MNRLWLGLGLLLGVIGIVGAQQIAFPPPAGVTGIACAYNASPPTLTTGNPGWVQCDSTGKIITSGGGGGGAVTVADGADVAQGSTTDAANCNSPRTVSGCLAKIDADITAPLTGGNQSAIIGTVGLVDSAGTNKATIKAASTAPANTDPAIVATLNGLGGPAPYPTGATPITASATGTTGATTATLAGTSGKTTYICGYSIRANATAAATVTNTITGVITATLSSVMWVAPLASGLGIDEQIFSPCIPASATNTGIAIVSGAPGSGGTVSSKGWGYQL